MAEQIVESGKYVSLTYVIEDANGDIVERHDAPLGFVYGSDTELIGGMDAAVAGKRVGDQVQVHVTPEQCFGERDPDLTFIDDLANVPEEFHRLGAEVPMENENGDVKSFYVTRIEGGQVTIDGNHPLAGRDLTVRVCITGIRDARPGEELMSGIHAADKPDPKSIN